MSRATEAPSTTPVWALLATSAFLVTAASLSSSGGAVGQIVAVVMILIGGALALVATRRPRETSESSRWGQPGRAGLYIGLLVGLLALPGSVLVSTRLSVAPPVRLLLSAGVAAAGALAVAAPRSPRTGRWIAAGYAAAVAVITGVGMHTVSRGIDVYVFLEEGVRALLAGQNPYSITFPNGYGPAEVAAYYGPGVVVGDRIVFGFPYLPGTLLTSVPGYLLGDVRVSGALGLGLLGILVAASSGDLRSRVCAVGLVAGPSTLAVVTGAWTEPTQVALLGLSLLALSRGRLMGAAVLLGLLMVTKQYLIVVVPCLWLLRGYFRPRHVAVAAATSLAVTLPFLLTSPGGFWHSVVEWQLIQPFRPESISLLVTSVNAFGWPPPALYGVLPLVGGLLTAVGLAVRLRPAPWTFALAVGLSVLATILLSKQAFANYYFFVGGSFLIAAWLSGGPGARAVEGDLAVADSAYSPVKSRRSATDGDRLGSSPSPSAR